MRVRGSGRRQSRLSGAALLLGLGALSAAGAPADAAESHPGVSDVVIRTDGGRIYLSEGGREFQELHIADPAQLRRLQRLIAGSGTDAGLRGARLQPLILAGDGGAGFHWAPANKSRPTASRHGGPKQPAPAKAGTGAPRGEPYRRGGPVGATIAGSSRQG
jgi:hypothetical protein